MSNGINHVCICTCKRRHYSGVGKLLAQLVGRVLVGPESNVSCLACGNNDLPI